MYDGVIERVSVDLDTVDLNWPEFQEWLEAWEIKSRVVRFFGPGGGNPEVRYTGTGHAIETMVVTWWGEDVWMEINGVC